MQLHRTSFVQKHLHMMEVDSRPDADCVPFLIRERYSTFQDRTVYTLLDEFACLALSSPLQMPSLTRLVIV
jgi:hypothetical protein